MTRPLYKIENGTCHGRGFSGEDTTGLLAKFLSWIKRQDQDGSGNVLFQAAEGSNGQCYCLGHGYETGDSVYVICGVYPTGLEADTEYFIIKLSADRFKFATTYQNAMDNVYINVTETGSNTYLIRKGGGAGWFLIEDKSDPEIQEFTVKDKDTGVLTIDGGENYFGTGDRIRVSNDGGSLPSPLVVDTDYYVNRISGEDFTLHESIAKAYTNTDPIVLAGAGTGTHYAVLSEKYIVVTDTETPNLNDIDGGPLGLPPKYIKIGYVLADNNVIRIQHLLWWDISKHTGHGLWNGNTINTDDDGDFYYDFRGGQDSIFVLTRIGSDWSVGYVADWEGDAGLGVEGTDKYGTVLSPTTSGTDRPIIVSSLENFTVGNYYFIYDFASHSYVDRIKIKLKDVGANTLWVDRLTHDYPAGAIIAAYAHRFISGGTHGNTEYNGFLGDYDMAMAQKSKIPYTAAGAGYVFHTRGGYVKGYCSMGSANIQVSRMAPNNKGYFGTSELEICEKIGENSDSEEGHEVWGVPANILVSAKGDMVAGTDGRIDQEINYRYFVDAGSLFGSELSGLAALINDDPYSIPS